MSSAHLDRNVTGRSFSLHLRTFAKAIAKIDGFFEEYRKEVNSIFFNLKGQQLDKKMGLRVAGLDILKVDKGSLEGVQAHQREIKVFLKYMGFIRPENYITIKGENYLNANKNQRRALLIESASRFKITCPLIRDNDHIKGNEQASYGHYRIRPVIMTLYAIRKAQELKIEIDTDDILLSALRFYPPEIHRRLVDEKFLISSIDSYLAGKTTAAIDYKDEFTKMYNEVLSENGRNWSDEGFKQKCRNAANNVWCFLIFLEELGLVKLSLEQCRHWSSTEQVPTTSSTFPVAYHKVTLTIEGERVLNNEFNKIPIWFKDVPTSLLFMERNKIIDIFSIIGKDNCIGRNKVSEEIKSSLEKFGIKLREDGDYFIPEREIIFDIEYDIKE